MRGVVLMMLVGLTGLVPGGVARAADGVVATVNGQKIPQAFLDVRVAEQKARGAPDSPELERALRDDLIGHEVAFQEARRIGLDKNGAVAVQAELAYRQVLVNALFVSFSQTQKLERADVEGAYNVLKSRAGEREYKVRHISAATDEAARALLAELARGEKFEVLARKSTDPLTRDRGGDLGWINGASPLPPAMIQAAAELKKGTVSEKPIQTPSGFQILLLEDVRPTTFAPFEQVAGQIGQQILQERFRQYIAGLRTKAKIE